MFERYAEFLPCFAALGVEITEDAKNRRIRFRRERKIGADIWDWYPDSKKRTAYNINSGETIRNATPKQILERFKRVQVRVESEWAGASEWADDRDGQTHLGNNNETGGTMAGFERKRIEEIEARLFAVMDGTRQGGREYVQDYSAKVVYELYGGSRHDHPDRCFVDAAPDDIRFLLDLVGHLVTRNSVVDGNQTVAALMERLRIAENNISNLYRQVAELRNVPENPREGVGLC